MRMVRLAVMATVAVVVGGAAYAYRDVVAQRLGVGGPAKGDELAQSSPAAMAQPQGRRGGANPGGAAPAAGAKTAHKPTPGGVAGVGPVQAIASIQIKPRLASQIVEVHVEEGALVK